MILFDYKIQDVETPKTNRNGHPGEHTTRNQLRLQNVKESDKELLLSILSNLLIRNNQKSIEQDPEGTLIDENACLKLRQICLKAFHAFFSGKATSVSFDTLIKSYGKLLFQVIFVMQN